MKMISFIIFLFSASISDQKMGDDYNSSCPVKILEVNNSQIEDILIDISSTKKYNKDKAVFILNFIKDGKNIECRSSVVYRQDFGWLLRETKEYLYGYFEFNEYPVLVFGKTSRLFLKRTESTKKLDWTKKNKRIRKIKKDIAPPPIHFEPDVWIHTVEDTIFKFKKRGPYKILR